MHILDEAYATFWHRKFWLHENVTWSDLENKVDGPHKDIYHAQPRDLLLQVPLVLVLLSVRYLLNKIVFKPIGRYYKLKEGTIILPEKVPLLQRHYKKTGKRPEFNGIVKLAKELNWNTRKVERWFRKRRNYDKSSTMQKFCETCWRWLFYLGVHLLGIYILHDEEIIRKPELAWKDWPHQHVTGEFQFYYMIELAFYWSLLVTMLYDVKRSDYLEHLIHHIATISLMWFSYSSNFVRVGVLVLCLHDVVDHWLELAKLFKYVNYRKLCDTCYAIFTVLWLITRIYLFPMYLIYNAVVYEDGMWPGYLVFAVVLTLLFVMHCFWSYLILKAAYMAIVNKGTEDVRSASELSSISADNEHQNGKNKKID